MRELRIQADEAKRLKSDTAFQQFVQDVREMQMSIFADSEASELDVREEAHAILRALNQIEMQLDAAISAERILDRKQRN
jgi:hypothetical protein